MSMALNAWPQGASLDTARYPIDSAADYHASDHLFSVATSGYENDFPVLARAAHQSIPAHATRVEWLDTTGLHLNYTQIFRTPWTVPEMDEDGRIEEFLHKHMTSIEWALVHGTPQALRGGLLCFVGGVIHFLGREEVGPDDHVLLRPLHGRELVLRSWLNAGGSRTHEWLSEVSLEVY